LVLAFGGLVIPVVGWIAGAVLVVMSARWRRWEKLVAILTPFAVVVLIVVVSWVGSVAGAGSASQNPLVPASYDIAYSSIFLVFVILIPTCGLWLLWRLRRAAGTP